MQPQLLQSQRMLRPHTSEAQLSSRIIQQQEEANKNNARRYASSRLQNITLRELLADSGRAVETTFKAFHGNSKPVSVQCLVTTGDNYLRGIGFILVAFTSVAFMIQAASS